MNFYEDIAHRLYVWNTKIGETNFSSPFDFIEAKHLEAQYKGKVFYQNLIIAMPNHFGAKMRNDFFKEILQYCKDKIDKFENYTPPQTQSKSIAGSINDILRAEVEMDELFLRAAKVRKEKEQNNTPPKQTKKDKLKTELSKYGFFELQKIKQLSEPNKQSLVELISINDLPYSIAMFEYLGFLKYLKAKHFTTDYKLFKAVANWFEVTERAVKGNIYVLNEFSKENRKRYTADQQKQTVQKNYEALK